MIFRAINIEIKIFSGEDKVFYFAELPEELKSGERQKRQEYI